MVTVQRPNGSTETVKHPVISEMTNEKWVEFCKQMKKSGNGIGISFENKVRELREPKNEAEMKDVCDHQDRIEKTMREGY
jgi:hypothetical protein